MKSLIRKKNRDRKTDKSESGTVLRKDIENETGLPRLMVNGQWSCVISQ